MVTRALIIVGPKKTASSSIYAAIKASATDFHVLTKENNNLIRKKKSWIFRNYTRNIIDVSPEYFSSFRAIASLKMLTEKEAIEPHVLIIRRNKDDHIESYINYMAGKLEIDQDFTRIEWEKFFLQTEFKMFCDQWEKTFKTTIIDLHEISALEEFLSNYLGVKVSLEDKFENKGGNSYTITGRYIIAPLSLLLNRIMPSCLIEVVRKNKAMRKIAYRNSINVNFSLIEQVRKIL